MKLKVDFSSLHDCADMMTMSAFEMGCKAARNSRDINVNPFKDGDTRRAEWVEGFNSLSEER